MPSAAHSKSVSNRTYGGMLPRTLEAASRLQQEGIDAEVVDLRVLRPLDEAGILRSVSKTHRVIVVDEGRSLISFADQSIVTGASGTREGRRLMEEKIRKAKEEFLRLLAEIAPEINPSEIKPDKPLRDQIDIDSILDGIARYLTEQLTNAR